MDVYYHAVEKYPLSPMEYNELNFETLISGIPEGSLYQLHTSTWETIFSLADNFTVKKELSDFTSMNPTGKFDLVYFDAFAPEKQPVQRIQTRLEVSFGRLETIVAYLFERSLSGEEVAEALRLSNNLASKLATLGAAAAADLIRSAATLMDRDGIGPKDAITVAAVLDDARLAVASTVAATRVIGDNGHHLLVVSPSMVQADEMMWVAISQGMKVTYHENGLRPLYDGERPPDIVLVVLPDPDLAQAKPLLRAVEQQFFGVPVVAMCPSNTLRQRLLGVGQITTIMLLDAHPLEVMNELRLAVARLKQNREVVAIGKSSDWLSAKLTEHGTDRYTKVANAGQPAHPCGINGDSIHVHIPTLALPLSPSGRAGY